MAPVDLLRTIVGVDSPVMRSRAEDKEEPKGRHHSNKAAMSSIMMPGMEHFKEQFQPASW